MSTDTSTTRQLRDMNPDSEVIVQANGKTIVDTTVTLYVNDHDAAILEARKQGALMLLQQMEEVMYQVVSNGAVDELSQGRVEGYRRGVLDGMRTQLTAAKVAATSDLVDFTQELSE